MDDLRTRAQLVASDHAGAIGTVVARAEVADAAAGTEFPATLLLDLDRVETAEGGDVPAAAAVAQPAMGAERGLQQDEQVAATPAHADRGTAGFSVDPGATGQGPVVQPAGAERALLQDEQAAVTGDQSTGTAVTSTGGT